MEWLQFVADRPALLVIFVGLVIVVLGMADRIPLPQNREISTTSVPLQYRGVLMIFGSIIILLGISSQFGWLRWPPGEASANCQPAGDLTQGEDPRLETRPVLSSGQPVRLGESVQLDFEVKNYGSARTRSFHPYIQGTDPKGRLWGSLDRTTSITLGREERWHYSVRLPLDQEGTYVIDGIHLSDDVRGTYWRILPAGSCESWLKIVVQR